MHSSNRRFELAMQRDGNLVLYRQDRSPMATGTDGTGNENYLKMQEDGNLVLYTNQDAPLRAAYPTGSSARRLILKNNGDLVLCTRFRRILIRDVMATLN